MKKIQQGFTLIELMIVVAIVGILAAVALPAYSDYTKRAHVSEGLSLAEGAKTAITEFYSDRNTWPTDNAEAGLAGPTDISGNAVTSVTVAGNAITVQFNAMVNSQTLILEGTANDGSFTWTCNTGTVENRWRPARCR